MIKIIGITGQSGSGKTTLCDIIKENYCAKIIDADKVAKALSNDVRSEYFFAMQNLFGKDCLKADGTLNRRKIANIIYTNTEKRESLNDLTFNYVVREIEKEVEDTKKTEEIKEIEKLAEIKNEKKDKFIVIDAPLLYEANIHKICDFVIAVVARNENKVDRICLRDGIDRELAIKRLEIQANDEFYIKNADYIIYNDNDVENLEESFRKIVREK